MGKNVLSSIPLIEFWNLIQTSTPIIHVCSHTHTHTHTHIIWTFQFLCNLLTQAYKKKTFTPMKFSLLHIFLIHLLYLHKHEKKKFDFGNMNIPYTYLTFACTNVCILALAWGKFQRSFWASSNLFQFDPLSSFIITPKQQLTFSPTP
jgi:hypothetical protein